MVKVGTIAIDLIAHTGKLLKPLKRAETAVSGFASKFAKLGGLATAFAAPVLGAMTMARAISDVKESFASLGAISNESKRLGIPADQLMALQYAARQADVEMATLGKSLQFFMKGGGKLADLPKIADSISRMTNPTKRMQEALKLFGKGGAGMINLFEEGSAGLAKMTEEAHKLGRVFSQEQVDSVESAGDAWARIGEMIKAVSDRIAIELAPYVTWLSDQIVNMGTDGETTFGEKIANGIDYAIDKMGVFADAVWSMRKEWAYAMLAVADFSATMDAAWLQANANMRELANWLAYMDQTYDISKKVRQAFGFETLADKAAGIGGKPRFRGQEALAPYDQFGANKAQQQLASFTEEAERLLRGMGKNIENLEGGPKPSELLKDMVAFMRSGGGRSDSRGPGLDLEDIEDIAATAGKAASMAGAFERGSTAAMSAIAGTQRKNIEEQQLTELRKIKDGVESIIDDAVLLRRANLA